MHGHFLLKYLFHLILALCILIHPFFVQADNKDLKAETREKEASDTAKVNSLNNVGWLCQSSDPSAAKKYFHRSILLADKIFYDAGLIVAYNKLGIICRENGEYDSAIYFHLKCLKISEKTNDKYGIFQSYENLGNAYSLMEDSSKSVSYFRKALEFSKIAKDTLSTGKAYIGLGNLYMGYGQTAIARSWYNKALDICKKYNDKPNLAHIYNNIGSSYYNDSNYKAALIYFYKNAEIKKGLKDLSGLAYVYENIATAYIKINKDSALHYFNLSIDLAKKVQNPSILMETYRNMVPFYLAKDDYEKALKISEKYHAIKDSIFTITKTKAITNIQSKYDSEKKEQQIALLMADKKFSHLLRNSLIGLILLVLVIVIVLYNRYRFERRSIKTISAEKSRSDELLLNILPSETAEELKKYGKTSAKYYDEVSVLFADIIGFSQISQQMSPQALVADLDKYFGAFDLIMEKYGLEKIKTIGDAYLAAGGLPHQDKGTPVEVINAAIEMQQYVESLKKEKAANDEPLFEVRIGVHTGPIVAGGVGIKKFAYDIWGDTVNTAARMEQYGVAGKVNISEQTYQIVKDHFNCTFRGNIEVKNRGVFAMYFVEGVRDKA